MPPFRPYPPDSLRQTESSRSNGAETRMPYTKAYMAALKLGYTRYDLTVMPYGEVIFDFAAMNDGRPTEQEQQPDVVDATQEDIRTMLG